MTRDRVLGLLSDFKKGVKVRSRLFKVMRDQDVLMHDLRDATGICTSRISSFRNLTEVPSADELKLINGALGSDLTKEDFPVDEERIKELRLYEKAIKLVNEAKRLSPVGSVKCPKCGGELFYTVHPKNRHVTAMCHGKKCFTWMN